MIGGAAPRIGLAGLLGLFLACGDDGYALEYEGTAGRPTPATFIEWVPGVELTIEGGEPRLFLVDTGAPLTMMDNDSYPQFADGSHLVDVEGLGLTFPDLPVVAVDVFAYEQPPDATFHGILGGDVLQEFSLSLDYQRSRVWLSEDLAGSLPADADPDAVDPVITVDADVRGGGLARVPGECPDGCGTIELPATRFLVDISLEDREQPVRALVDSGASISVVREGLLDQLGDGGRPRLDGILVGTASGLVTAYITRVWSLRVDGTDEPVEQVSAPVLVLPQGDGLFASLAGEVGVQVDAIVGASFLREFLVTLDYRNEQMQLARYVSRAHIDDGEYVGVGFTIAPNPSGAWVIDSVFPGTDADSEGLAEGEAIVDLGGQRVNGLSFAQIEQILAAYQIGDEVPVSVQRGADVVSVNVAVEDLLPAFEAP